MRPPEVVFKDRMQRAYESYLGLIGKVRSLSRHRALRSDNGESHGKTLNAFIGRMAEELNASKVQPGVMAEQEETPTITEFITGE